MLKKILPVFLCSLCCAVITACSPGDNGNPWEPSEPGFNGGMGGIGGSTGSDDTSAPDFDPTIYPYSGQMAQDAADDKVGTDADLFHELNTFDKKVDITYNGNTATVTTSSADIITYVEGAHVVVDMLTNSVKNVNITLKGTSTDGSLKVYGEKKFLLTLAGVDLQSSKGPAINSQCKKRMFVYVKPETVNTLCDAATYSSDIYYYDPATAADEDRKGCLFAEGNLIFSGTGLLKVAGKYRHGIVTDGYFYMRPGVTIAVTEAAKNAVHVKGDDTDGIGATIQGGLLYTYTASDAGKGIKCDMMVTVNGGILQLNTAGKAIYDSDERDTSSAAAIKSDTNVYINGGSLTLKSTGQGGKGINTDGDIYVAGGVTTITTTGGKYYYSNSLTSSPKGVKADGNFEISGGELNISVTGISDGSEGLESKKAMTIKGGSVYVYAYDDAINAGTAYTQSAGRVFAHAINNDGIDSNGSLTFSGGLAIASGTKSPEEAFDTDNSSQFAITGGTLIGIGGSALSPGSRSTQNTVICGGLSAAKDQNIAVLNSSGQIVVAYKLHRSLSGYCLFISSPSLAKGSYTVNSGGTIDGYTSQWCGYYDGGKWTGGSQLASFTVANQVTTVGSVSSSPGGGMGGGMGGWH